jgi:hypothetical protein
MRVEDDSMAPYFRPGDQLWIEEETGPPQFGQLVLVQDNLSRKLMIRRFLPGGRLVCDAPERAPEISPDQLRILGVVTGRAQGARLIAYNENRALNLHRVQAALAWASQGERTAQRVARSTLRIFGQVFSKILRQVEERW